MNIDSAFESKYLKCADLQNRTIQVSMSNVVVETVGQGAQEEQKPVLYFSGAKKGLVLNRINSNTIAEFYGKETDTWSGKRIELYPAKTEYAGKLVDCIRIRIPKGVEAQAPIESENPDPDSWQQAGDAVPFDDDIPF